MHFEIIGPIAGAETIARGNSVRSRVKLHKRYGKGTWRKCKGNATIRLPDGSIHRAELHWYEAHGIGRKEFKIKRFLD